MGRAYTTNSSLCHQQLPQCAACLDDVTVGYTHVCCMTLSCLVAMFQTYHARIVAAVVFLAHAMTHMLARCTQSAKCAAACTCTQAAHSSTGATAFAAPIISIHHTGYCTSQQLEPSSRPAWQHSCYADWTRTSGWHHAVNLSTPATRILTSTPTAAANTTTADAVIAAQASNLNAGTEPRG